MANNLIVEAVVMCGNLSCSSVWQAPSQSTINKCPKCGWESDGDKVLIERDLRKEGLKVDATSNT